MSETVKVAEFIAPQQTKSGKLTPPKFRDGNGRVFVIGKEDVELIRGQVHNRLEVEFGSINKYNEYPLLSVKVPEPEPAKPQGNGGWKRDPEEGRLIVRQSCLKAAVDHVAASAAAGDASRVLETADRFVAWVYGQVADAGAADPGRTSATPSPRRYTTGLREGEDLATAAQRALDEHDPMAPEWELSSIPPADAVEDGPSNRTPYPRERMAPSGARRR